MHSGSQAAGEEAALAARVADLDQRPLTALVADLWAARGFDTSVEDGRVVATDGARQVVVAPVAGGWLRRGTAPSDADVVVAPGRWPPSAPADAEVLDAADLAGMLRYAVGPAEAERLCERHLGGPPSALAPPLPVRARARLGAVRRGTVTLAALAALLLVGAVASLGGGGAPTPGGTKSPTASPAGETASTPTAGNVEAVPGIGPSGITNLSALANAHQRTLTERSFTAWLDVYAPRDGDPNLSRVQRDVDVEVSGNRFGSTTTIEGPDGRTRTRGLYHNGNDTFVANFTGEDADVRRATRGEAAIPIAGSVDGLRRSVVTTYLGVRRSEFAGTVTEDGRTLYRIEGSGAPRSAYGVSDYAVVALVDRRGLVRDISAEFVLQQGRDTYPARVEVTYGEVGSTTLAVPSWYRRAYGDGVELDVAATGATPSADVALVARPAIDRHRTRLLAARTRPGATTT